MSHRSSVAAFTFNQSESKKEGHDAVPVAEAIAAEPQPMYLSRAPSQSIAVTLAERSYGLENNMVHPTYCQIVLFCSQEADFYPMSFYISLSLPSTCRCMSKMLLQCQEFIMWTSQDTGGMTIVKRRTMTWRVPGIRMKAS